MRGGKRGRPERVWWGRGMSQKGVGLWYRPRSGVAPSDGPIEVFADVVILRYMRFSAVERPWLIMRFTMFWCVCWSSCVSGRTVSAILITCFVCILALHLFVFLTTFLGNA